MMALESLILALPILLFAVVFLRQPAAAEAVAGLQQASDSYGSFAAHACGLADGFTNDGPIPLFAAPRKLDYPTQLVYAVGAGLYEELLFRVIGIALVHALFFDLLALPKHVGELASIGITAVLFALYHYFSFRIGAPNAPPVPDGVLVDMFTVHIRKTIFFLLAGVYLACIYVYRGFGIVAGAHALYDVLVATLAQMRGE
jgi:membrane protease YdiL (CAAX protease family)